MTKKVRAESWPDTEESEEGKPVTETEQKETAKAPADTAQKERQFRGLYRYVNISVRTLNILIVVLCAALIACLAFGISKRGYQVTFDSLGGTAVESQTRMYGELLETPETPTREGYIFDGWYLDVSLTIPWDLEQDTVTESMTLYASWTAEP